MIKKVLAKISPKAFLFWVLPSEFKSAFGLLDLKARVRYLLLSSSQIFLAFLEVVSLSLITLTITLSLNNYTRVSSRQEETTGFFIGALTNLNVENQIGTLLATYIALTILKTLLSAKVTMSSLNLLANQAVRIGLKLNRKLYQQGGNLIRFGKSQESLSGVTASLDSLLIGYLGAFSQMMGDLATILIVCAALLLLDFETSLILIFLFVFLLATLHLFVNTAASQLGQEIMKSNAKLNRRILDSWLVYREILLAQKVDELLRPTFVERSRIARNKARLSFLPSLSKYIFELFMIVSALVVAGFQLWINGVTEAVSSFVLIVAAAARLLPALLRLQGNLLSIKQAKGAGVFARQIIERISKELIFEQPINCGTFQKESFNPTVLVEGLSYIYPESTEHAVKEISLSITPGTFTAITGPSGSGKSTLIDLILGFLEPTTGSVLVSGINARTAQEVWPGRIAYVPQDVQIFEGSILENITLSTTGQYDSESLASCIEASGLLEDLDGLNIGTHTLIGERGLRLSGGQKQRLGIARALYGDPKLLVFDEATSSLDPITEEKIAKNVFRRLPDRAVIVVAHRLSTVRQADTVLYLKNGRVRSSGKFEELKKSEPDFLEQAELSGL